MFLPLYWDSSLATRGGLFISFPFRFHIPNIMSHSQSHPYLFLGAPSNPRTLSHPGDAPHHLLQFQISNHFHGHLGIFPVLPYTLALTLPFPPHCPFLCSNLLHLLLLLTKVIHSVTSLQVFNFGSLIDFLILYFSFIDL